MNVYLIKLRTVKISDSRAYLVHADTHDKARKLASYYDLGDKEMWLDVKRTVCEALGKSKFGAKPGVILKIDVST